MSCNWRIILLSMGPPITYYLLVSGFKFPVSDYRLLLIAHSSVDSNFSMPKVFITARPLGVSCGAGDLSLDLLGEDLPPLPEPPLPPESPAPPLLSSSE